VENESRPRAIIHLDMDCFYAAIEVRDRPSLGGKPVGVGGARERRGVLTTCNYEARKFGVRSAMPTFMALQRCPNLIVLPTRFDVYRREAAVIRGILHRFTSLIEPLSLDEAYLDVTAHPGAPGPLAQVIRGTIFRKMKLTSSAGVGPNKLIAKIASEINKPNGQFEVALKQVPEFMDKLPVRKIWGIGEKTERKPAASCSVSRVRSLSIFLASLVSISTISAAASITGRSNRIVRANRSAPRKHSLSILPRSSNVKKSLKNSSRN